MPRPVASEALAALIVALPKDPERQRGKPRAPLCLALRRLARALDLDRNLELAPPAPGLARKERGARPDRPSAPTLPCPEA